MPDTKGVIKNILIRFRGETLVGLVCLVSGLIVAWKGVAGLRVLYRQFSVYFPLSPPLDIGRILLDSMPLIFASFISTMGSFCAVVLGVMWALSGAIDAVKGRKPTSAVPDFTQPEIVAESLRVGDSLHWHRYGWIVRLVARLWPRARYIDPVSYKMLRQTVVSIVQIGLITIVIAVLFQFLHALPRLMEAYFRVKISLAVPSATPLYWMLAILIAGNALIGISLIPFRKRRFLRSSDSLRVRGTGDPHLFLALLEESCQLLSTKGRSLKKPIRLEIEENPRTRGSLIESFPDQMPSAFRPAGYLCLPLVPIFLILGFSRLINFHRPLGTMSYADFFSVHFLDYGLEVAFAVVMIICGIYFAEWARRLLTIRRYRSAAVFCHLAGDEAPASKSAQRSARARRSDRAATRKWRTTEGIDSRFAAWAKAPHSSTTFPVTLHWAEVVWEAATEEGPRFLVNVQQSELLENSMRRLIQLPFKVAFQIVPDAKEPVAPSPHAPDHSN